jgi:hypothetical protein
VSTRTVTAFRGQRLLASGALRDVAQAVWHILRDRAGSTDAVLIFDDDTGRVVDLEMRGDESDMLAHIDAHSLGTVDARANPSVAGEMSTAEAPLVAGETIPRGRGRPRLGVVAREITLLPRHWAWLASQPGGASVSLRRLVDEARHTHAAQDRATAARNAAYTFMSAMAGDLLHFEEAIRALYRHDEARLRTIIATWPPDIRDYASRLAFPERESQEAAP